MKESLGLTSREGANNGIVTHPFKLPLSVICPRKPLQSCQAPSDGPLLSPQNVTMEFSTTYIFILMFCLDNSH